jgi:hypothetical protein
MKTNGILKNIIPMQSKTNISLYRQFNFLGFYIEIIVKWKNMENTKRALLKLIENSLRFLRDFRAHNEQTKNNLDSRDNKLNGRPNRKSQINGAQKKANQSKKEIEGAKTKRDIVRSFSI